MTMTESLAERNNHKVVKIADHRYELLARIDRGATAIVWKARLVGDQEIIPDASMVPYSFLEGQEAYEVSDSAGEHEFVPEDLIALKIPRSEADRQSLQQEGKRLAQLRARNVPGIVELKYDYFSKDFPYLALSWVQGQQLSQFEPSNPERDGLRIAARLAAILRAAFSAGFFLTDTMKPDSVFWEPNTGQLTLIDFGIMGDLLDTESKTLPFFGNTLHRVLTGLQPITRFDTVPYQPESYGRPTERWSALSYGTRRIVRRLFTDKYLPEPIERVAGRDQSTALLRAIGRMEDDIISQAANWDKPVDHLRVEVRQAQGAEAVNLLDIVQLREARSGRALTNDEQAILREAWQTVVHDELIARDRSRMEYRLALPEMAIAHSLYERDANIHRVHLLLEAASNASATPEWWPGASLVTEQLEQGDDLLADKNYDAAIESYAQATAGVEQLPTDQNAQLPSWLLAEAAYLSSSARLQAELAARPWDARDAAIEEKERRLKDMERTLDIMRRGSPWPEYRDRYLVEYEALAEQVERLNTAAREAQTELNELAAQGELSEAERRLESLRSQFQLETEAIESTLRQGRATKYAVAEVHATETASERAAALRGALDSAKKAIGEGYERERIDLVQLTIAFLLGRVALDRYAEALDWLEQVREIAPPGSLTGLDTFEREWRRKGEYQRHYFPDGRLPKETEDLEKAIRDGFFFAPDLSDLHAEWAARLSKDNRPYSALAEYEGVPDLEQVRSRVPGHDGVPPWLGEDETTDISTNRRKAATNVDKLAEDITRLRQDFLEYDLEQVGAQSDGDLLRRASLLLSSDNTKDRRNEFVEELVGRAADERSTEKALFYLGIAETIAPDMQRRHVRDARRDQLEKWLSGSQEMLDEQREQDRRRINQQLFDQLRVEQMVGNLTILLRQAQNLPPTIDNGIAWTNLTRLLDDLQEKVDIISEEREGDIYWDEYQKETLEPQLRDIRGVVSAYQRKLTAEEATDILAGKDVPELLQPAVKGEPLSGEDYTSSRQRQQWIRHAAHFTRHMRDGKYADAGSLVPEITDEQKIAFVKDRQAMELDADGKQHPAEDSEG